MTNEIQRKHVKEREAVVNDALYESMNYLIKAHNHFGAAIQDRGLQNQFAEGVGQAQQVLLELGIEF